MKRLKRWVSRVVGMSNLLIFVIAFMVPIIATDQSDSSSSSVSVSRNQSHLPTHLRSTNSTPLYPIATEIKPEIAVKRKKPKASRKTKKGEASKLKFLQASSSVPESLLNQASFLLKSFTSTKMSKVLKSLGMDNDRKSWTWKGIQKRFGTSESESTARLFLAPVMAAVPVMFFEIMAIGGMGLMGPAMLFLPLFMILLVPFAFLAFILFI